MQHANLLCRNCQFKDFLCFQNVFLGMPLTAVYYVHKLIGIYFICKNDSLFAADRAMNTLLMARHQLKARLSR